MVRISPSCRRLRTRNMCRVIIPHTWGVESFGCRKRQEAYVITAPPWMLDRRALMAAGGAAGALPQPVARYACTPPDDGHRAGQRRVMLAALAPEPYPRRCAL